MKTNHRLLCLAPVSLLMACSSHADSGPPAATAPAPVAAPAAAAAPAIPPKRPLLFRPGSYSAQCAIDSTQRLRLVLAYAKDQYPVQLYGRGDKLLAQGNLQLDTLNYDRQDSIFSFRTQGQVYAFIRERAEDGTATLRLINEDYKKSLQYCFDGKSISFEPQPR